jgi:thiol-disulfide isomerase/thioredoxin
MRIRLFAIMALALMALGAFAPGPKSTPDEMIAAIKAVKNPPYDASKGNDKAYVAQYQSDIKAAFTQRADLILAFYKEYPTNEQTPALMSQRWGMLMNWEENYPTLQKELDEVITAAPSDKLVETGTFYKANLGLQTAGDDGKKAVAAAELFTNKYPKDPRGASLLGNAAEAVTDKAEKVALYNKILADYPDGRGTKYIKGKVNQINGLGKPFDLTFEDAISGKKTTIADFKGKVVVIDFWATWCGPCKADLPKMRKMYADLHDKGLEIISVSLDQPRNDDPSKDGLKKLKDFVATGDMPWHHYYQGNFWDSEFSTSWGINSIPCLFLVDRNGMLVDVQAREGIEDRAKKLLDKS